MTKFGKYDSAGAVEQDVDECILTGRKLEAPFDATIRQRVSGTSYFYRIIGSQYHRVTPAHMDFWAAHAGDEKLPELDESGAPIASIGVEVKSASPVVRSSSRPTAAEKKNIEGAE